MIDIKFLRENPDLVKENIKKKFQDAKLPLVDEVIALDAQVRAVKQEGDDLRAAKNKISKEIGGLMAQGKKEEAETKKAEVAANAKRLAELEAIEPELQEKIKKRYKQLLFQQLHLMQLLRCPLRYAVYILQCLLQQIFYQQ